MRGFKAILAFLVLIVRPVSAADFKGVNDLSVLVEHLPTLATDAGLTTQALQRTVEEKLKLGNVPLSQPKFPYLYLNVMVLKTITNGFSFKCTLALKEKAILARNPQKWHPVSTWQRDVLGLSPSNELEKSVMECAQALTANFLLEYQRDRGVASSLH